jgi:hypothetical protein
MSKNKSKKRLPRGMKANQRIIAALDASGLERAKGFEKPPILSGAEAVAALKGKGESKKRTAATANQESDKEVTGTIDAGGGILVDVVEKVGPKAKTSKTKKRASEPKAKKTSGLDAAYEVLKATGEPMTCKEIVEEMLAKGLWKTSGHTPSATIYSAMLREIDAKPGESRFVKTGKGLFAAAKN